jgi:hypothetical protein
MKRLLAVITAFYLMLPSGYSQLWKVRRLELTAGIGTTQFFSDIGGYPNNRNLLGLKDFTFKQTRFNINENIRYRITENLSARLNLIWGQLHSTDARGSNIDRGFEESTIFFEHSVVAEYHFIRNKEEISFILLRENNNYFKSLYQSTDLYLFAGLGGLSYHVNPNEKLTPEIIQASGYTGVIPLGFGLNMIYSDKLNFGVELGGRFTNSDLIDGWVGAKSRKDVYHLLNFTITYKIRTEKCIVAGR